MDFIKDLNLSELLNANPINLIIVVVLIVAIYYITSKVGLGSVKKNSELLGTFIKDINNGLSDLTKILYEKMEKESIEGVKKDKFIDDIYDTLNNLERSTNELMLKLVEHDAKGGVYKNDKKD